MNAARFLPALLLAASCTPAPAPLTEAQRDAVREEVRAATFALQDALNAHVPEDILAFYALDEDFVYVGCTDYLFGGSLFGTIVAGYHRQNPEALYDLALQRVRVLAPDAAVASLQGAAGQQSQMFVTRALQRDDAGRWTIVYEHESWPGCADPRPPHPGTAPGDTALAMPEPGGGAF